MIDDDDILLGAKPLAEDDDLLLPSSSEENEEDGLLVSTSSEVNEEDLLISGSPQQVTTPPLLDLEEDLLLVTGSPTDDVVETVPAIEEVEDDDLLLAIFDDTPGISSVDTFDSPLDLSDTTDSFDVEQENSELGIQIPLEESIARTRDFCVRQLEFMETSMESKNMVSEGIDIMEEASKYDDLKFLTMEEQVRIMTYISGSEDPQEIFGHFMQSRTRDHKPVLSNREQLDVHSYIRKVLHRYQQLSRNRGLLASTRNEVNQFMYKRVMPTPKAAAEVFYNASPEQSTYFKGITTYADRTEYVCGHCETNNVSTDGIFMGIISDRSVSRNEYFVIFPLANHCVSCGYLNMLPYVEREVLHDKINRKYDVLLADWRRNPRKLSSSGNIITYNFGKKFLPEFLPQFAKQGTEAVVEVEVGPDWDKETIYQRYLITANISKLLAATRTANHDGMAKSVGMEIDHVEQTLEFEKIARIYCKMFRANFDNLRARATASVVDYFVANPLLLNSVDPTNYQMLETLLALRIYLDTEETFDRVEVFTLMGERLNVRVEFTGNDISPATRKAFELEFEDLALYLETAREGYESSIDYLYESIELYRFIPLKTNTSYELIDAVKAATTNPRFVEWMRRVTLLMIIDSLQLKIREYWSSLQIRGIKTAPVLKFGTVSIDITERLRKHVNPIHEEYSREEGSIIPNPIVMVNQFLSSKFMKDHYSTALYLVKQGIDNNDRIKFSEGILKLQETFVFRATAFLPFTRLLKTTQAECRSFLETLDNAGTDNPTVSYYLYHYEGIFSREEILSSVDTLVGTVKYPVEIARLDGETFTDYLQRIRSGKADEERSYRLSKDWKYFRKLTKYLPALHSLLVFMPALKGTTAAIQSRLLMNDLIYYGYVFGNKYIYDFLGLMQLPVEITDYSSTLAITGDWEQLVNNLRVQTLVYDSAEVNDVVRGDSDDYLTIEKLIEDDATTFKVASRLFPEWSDTLFEYYSG